CFDDVTIPVLPVRIGRKASGRAEEAVADRVTPAEVLLVRADQVVQFGQPIDDAPHEVIRDPTRLQVTAERGGAELRLQLDEDKAAAQGIVYHREGTVGGVHKPDQVDVLGHAETLFPALGIRQGDAEFRPALVRLDEHQGLAENLAEVPAVDFVDEEDERMPQVEAGAATEVIEHAVAALEAAISGAIALDEVLVRVGLVELHHFNPGSVLYTHESVGDLSGDVSLADPRR